MLSGSRFAGCGVERWGRGETIFEMVDFCHELIGDYIRFFPWRTENPDPAWSDDSPMGR